MRRTLSALAATTALLLGIATPANAASTTFSDPAGDGSSGDRLDITSGTLRNGDRQLVVEVSYVRASRGSLIVFLKARRVGGMIRVISEHRPNGEDENYLLDSRGQRQACGGLRVAWDDEADSTRVRLPSHCFHEGDYGAVRTFLLTEIGGGGDVDDARAPRQSMWTARG